MACKLKKISTLIIPLFIYFIFPVNAEQVHIPNIKNVENEPYIENKTGLVFPYILGGIKRNRISTINLENSPDTLKNTSFIRYYESNIVIADFFINDVDPKYGIAGTGIHSKIIAHELELLRQTFLIMQEAGSISFVKQLVERDTSIRTSFGDLCLLQSSFILGSNNKESGSWGNKISHVFYTFYNNKMIKLRFSYPENKKNTGEKYLKQFLVDLGTTISPPKNEFPLKCPKYDFLKSAATGDYLTVKKILDSGYNVNVVDNSGTTALFYASDKGHDQIVSFLLATGANPDIQSNNGFTALMGAIHSGNEKTIKLLLEAGADTNLKIYNKNLTALHIASIQGAEKITELLLKHGAKETSDSSGLTPLMFAASLGHINVLRLLLKHGFDINAKQYDGYTALIHAAAKNQKDCVKLLIKNGAEIKAKTDTGETALKLQKNQGIQKL